MSLMQKVSSSSAIAFLTALLFAGASPLAAQTYTYSTGTSQVSFNTPAGVSPQPQSVSVTSTPSGGPLNPSIQYFNSPPANWLTATATTATAPGSITFNANPTGLTNGQTYSALVNVAPGGASILVSLAIGGSGTGNGAFTANPSPINLSSSSPSVAVTVSSNTGGSFPLSFSTSTNGTGNWLSVSPTSGSTGVAFVVTGNPSGLANTTYTGSVTVTGNNSSLIIPVNFNVSGSTGNSGLVISQYALNFSYQPGGQTPASQSVSITTPNLVSYTAISNAGWLLLSGSQTGTQSLSASGSSGSTLTVSISPAGLTSNSYTGTITVYAGNATQTINVTLTANSTGGALTSSPGQLTFNYFPSSGVPAGQTIYLTSANGSAISFNAVSSATWLQVNPTSGNVSSGQAAFVASVSPTGLGNGSYNGNIQVTSTALGTLNIPVILNVGTTGGSSSITLSTNTVTFQGQLGQGLSPTSVSVSSPLATSQPYTVTAGSLTPTGWFTVNTTGGSTPGSFNIVPNIGAITVAGSYTGTVTVTNTADNTSQTIQVTLNIGSGTVTVAPTSLNFAQAAGGSAPASQTLQVSNSTTGATYTASSNQTWLTVSPTSGSTPATLTVSVNSSGLSPSTTAYTGTITISGGTAPVTVPVNFILSATSTPTATPTSLTFNYQNGGTAPATQTVSIGSTGSAISFSAAATTQTGTWLSVTPASGTTPGTLTVSVTPTGLVAGNYSGTITVTGTQANQTVSIPVTLNVTGVAAPVVNSLTNAGSFQSGPVAPGEIITIKGSGMGPATGVSGTVSAAGALITNVSGVRVLFDGIESPLLYVRADQINAIAPYEIFGRVNTQIAVEYQGVRSTALQLNVADTAPGIFTLDASGKGQGAIVNQNGTVNGPTNPAPIGTIVAIYATGEGQTNPPGQDGRIISTDLRKPLQNVSVKIGGVSVPVVYAGSAPSLVSGALQVNVRLTGVSSGTTLPIEIDIGNGVSASGVTIAVQ
jgi:trimeric autotransporter adhesin